MKHALGTTLSCGLLLACAGAAPAPKVAEPVARAAAAAPVAVVKKPSAELSRYWTFAEEPPLSLYGDVASLSRSDLLANLLPALLGNAGDALSAADRSCLSALLQHAREVLVGAGGGHSLTLLWLGSDGVTAARAACVGGALPAARVTLTGSDEAYATGDDVIAVLPTGVVLHGRKALVEAALSPAAKPAPLPQHFTLSGEQQVVFRFELPQPSVLAHGSLSITKERFLLSGQFQLPSDAMADELERGVAARTQQLQKMATSGGGQATLGRLLSALELKRQGRRFNARFELRGSPAEQAQDLSALAAMGVAATSKYVKSAKVAEAKMTLAQITKGYQAALLPAEGKPKQPKKLVSLPAVPATVPRGQKQQTSAEDWKGWAPIQFRLEGPQSFQYEVVAAKDGRSADVLARGDLNGDGKTSLFRLKVQLDPKTGQLTAQSLDETDPFE